LKLPRIANPWRTRSLKSWNRRNAIRSRQRADDEPDERDDQRLALVLERVAPVHLGQVREHAETGEDADRQRPGEDPGGDDEVEERLDDQRRGERRVGRPLDAVVDEVELEDVAAARRDDRIDADACEVGAEHRAARDEDVGVGGADDVPPGGDTDDQAGELEAEGDSRAAPSAPRRGCGRTPRRRR
jgi:hypothetical protein